MAGTETHEDVVAQIEAAHFQGGESGGISHEHVQALKAIAPVSADARRLLQATVGYEGEEA